MSERKMATIRKIAEIKAIPEADLICAYRVDGWWVVDSVGKYAIDDLVVYAEPDSWIPTELAPFLSKGKEPREYNGVKGEKLRTIRLKKQLSQGLLMPLNTVLDNMPLEKRLIVGTDLQIEGNDVSDDLRIQKYEAPIAANLAGTVRGNFPSRIPKTDQERIQNLPKELEFWKEKKFTWSVSEKCEGSSHTTYMLDGEFGVCSRNLDLKEDENNVLWKTAIKYDLKNKLIKLNRNLAIQSELLGPGIQGNIYQLKDHMLVVFDIYDIDEQEYLYPTEKKSLIEQLGFISVPILNSSYSLTDKNVDELLLFAEGKSVMGMIGCEREGLVFNCNECHASFKVVSNRYLLKQ